MKTALNIKDTLLAYAEALAAQERTSLARLIEEGLRLRLRTPQIRSEKSKTKDSRLQRAGRSDGQSESAQQ